MKKKFRYIDKPLFIITIIFSIIGLLMVFSASSIISSFNENISTYNYFARQLFFIFCSYLFFFIVLLNYHTKNYAKFLPLFRLILLAALVTLFIWGFKMNGSRSWFSILGLFNLQPSEFAKLYIILFLGFFFQKVQKKDYPTLKYYYPILTVIIIIILVLLQPDTGTALVIILLTIGIYFVTPLSFKKKKIFYIISIFLAIIGLTTFIFKDKIFKDYQINRFNIKEPCLRYEDSGYQLCNSYIAINNGGLFGVGLGNSTQKYLYLPAGHTDFIFAIIVEELGSIIAIVILVLYIIMFYRIYLIAKRADNISGSIIAFGSLILISIHCVINLGGILGLIPLTGIPLPFLSYGGSFTIVTYLLIFIVQRIAVENNQTKIKKEISSL